MIRSLSYSWSRGSAGPAALVLLVLAIGLPLFSEPLGLSNYAINIVGQIATFALLALAHDLIWGYAGILSLGHGVFFAMGGYLMAMHLLKVGYETTGTRPDFMVFMGWDQFPEYWAGLEFSGYAIFLILVLPAVLAFVFGWLAFRSRVSGVYFAIITQALTYSAMLLMARNDTGFGGTNGMTGFSTFFGMPIASREAVVTMATTSIVATLVGFVMLAMLMSSSFGRLMIAIRDDEPRLRFLGTNTLWPKLAAWCLSAVLAAIAGALYVPQVGIINPTQLSPANSIEIAVWVAVGGRGYLVGALVGATLVNVLKFWLTGFAPALWPFILAGLVLVIAVALNNGLMDIGDVRQRIRQSVRQQARRLARHAEKRS